MSDDDNIDAYGHLIGLAIGVWLGAWAFQYLLQTFAHKDIPWYLDALVGLFAGAITIPVAVVVWVLKLAGAL